MNERNAWIASVTVLVLGIVGIAFLRTSATTLGDWGDYVGAVVTTITLIWLVVAHHQGQEDLAETNRQVERQARLNEEILDALNRLANSATLDAQSKRAMQQPEFRFVDSTFHSSGGGRGTFVEVSSPKARPVLSGSIRFRNQGYGCTLVSIESNAVNVIPSIKARACPTQSEFVIELSSTVRINNLRFELKIDYDDLLKTRRRTVIVVDNCTVDDIRTQFISDGG